MTQDIKDALTLALEALEGLIKKTSGQAIYSFMETERRIAMSACVGIKEALREHAMREVQRLGQEIEQEPVKMVSYNCTCGRTMKFESVHGVVAPQRTWVGLTDEEIHFVRDSFGEYPVMLVAFARAIEAKLKKKNT